MYLSEDDLAYWSKEIEQQLKVGNQWAVFRDGTFLTQFEDGQYFKTKADAKDYCMNNISDKDYFKFVAIEPLYNAMQQISNAVMNRNGIDYYVIDENNFEVSRVLKVNPDQNPLYNPDGNRFTDELISHMERENCKEKKDQGLLVKYKVDKNKGVGL